MNRLAASLLAAAVLLAPAGLGAEQPLSAVLTLGSNGTKSPVPVTFKFTFTNASAEERQAPRKALLLVTPAGGEAFIARWRGATVADFGPESGLAAVVVPPRGTADLELLANPFFDSPGWFTDPRLYAPGRKKLQVVFSDALGDDASPATVGRLPDRVVTPPVPLEVRPARGQDKAACDFVRRQLGRDEPCPLHALGSQTGLIRQVWERFPKSVYRNYLVSRLDDDELPAQIARLEAAGAGQSTLPGWWNLLALARLYDKSGQPAKARQAYQRLAASPTFYFRDIARQRLAELGQ